MINDEELHGQGQNSSNNKAQTSEIKSGPSSKACDSAYGSNNSHSFKSGSSKSQQSRSSGSGSNASTEPAPSSHPNVGNTDLGTKSRKDKDPIRKRKVRAAKSPPSNLIVQSTNVPHDSNAGQPMVASTAVPTCSPILGTSKNKEPGTRSERPGSASAGLKPARSSTTTSENRALQAAALTRALDYLQNVSQTQPVSPTDENIIGTPAESSPASWRSVLEDPKETTPDFAFLEDDTKANGKDTFIAAVSLQDGVVTYVTSGLYEALGFPPEMWVGRSMLDFLHPKDRLVFTNQLTAGLMANSAARLDREKSKLNSKERTDKDMLSNTVCCRLRMYRGLRLSGFAVKEKKLAYSPFRVTLSLQKISTDGPMRADTVPVDSDDDVTYYLLAQASRLVSAYRGAEEKNLAGHFALRHNGNCLFSEVDLGCVPYLGHLPQDLLGTSVLDLYHPNDLPVLKEIYAKVLSKQGKLVRSQPYHLRAYNGCYVLLETDWSCFINPWSKKVEFVVGQHRVLEGPSNPDVFASPENDSSTPVSEQDSETITGLHNDIKSTLCGCTVDNPPQEIEIMGVATRRRKDLAIFMGSLIDEVAKSGGSQSPVTFQGGASVVLGDISPHRGNSSPGSNSSDAPLSYTHLNYKENIDRFFASQPKMVLSGSSAESQTERRVTPNMSSEEEGRREARSGTSQGESSLKSSDKQDSSNSMEHRTSSYSSEDKYAGPALTTTLLTRHNQDMEKEFMQHHRGLRVRSGTGDRGHRTPRLPDVHGLKRTGAASWENGNVQKQLHRDSCASPASPPAQLVGHAPGDPIPMRMGMPGPIPLLPVNLWPPFCMSTTQPVLTSQPRMSNAPIGLDVARSGSGSPLTTVTVTNSVPGLTTYYMTPAPTQQQPRLPEPTNAVPYAAPFFVPQSGLQPFNAGAVPYSLVPCVGMPGVMYQPMGYGPFIMPSMMVQPQGVMNPFPSIPTTQSAAAGANIIHGYSSPEPIVRERLHGRRLHTTSASRIPDDGATVATPRPASQATSVKVEYGSAGASNISGPVHLSVRFAGVDTSASQGPESWEKSNQWPESSESYMDSASTSQANDQTRETSNGSTESQVSNNSSKNPPWMAEVAPTPEFTYQYQVPGKDLKAVLEADRQALSRLQQPTMLNDQLLALYREMESDQSEVELHLEECMTTSSDGGSSEGSRRQSAGRRRREEFRKTMIYEADGPIPKPKQDEL